METFACYSCGCAIAEDDYIVSKICPVCDSPLGNPQRRIQPRKLVSISRKREAEGGNCE